MALKHVFSSMNDEDRDRLVDHIEQNIIVSTTRNSYISSISRFILYLYSSNEFNNILTNELKDSLINAFREQDNNLELFQATTIDQSISEEERITRTNIYQNRLKRLESSKLRHIKEFINNNVPTGNATSEIYPINFDLVTSRIFLCWVVTLRKPDGSMPGNSSYSNHRAALSHLFREYNKSMSHELADNLSKNYLGLKRTTTQRIANGDGRVKIGKDPIDFSLYKYFGKVLSRSTNKENIFCHCFLIICWNLMCRAGNVGSICLDHIEWRNDALCVYFAHMKNDQTGERKRDPRHIYANPVNPAICPILSLGVYLLCFPLAAEQIKLFPGNTQYQRFSKLLNKLMEDECAEELEQRGLDLDDIGTHSIRKGASTYVSSGSTACPSASAIQIRAGWSLPGVQNTYLRYDSAGDMHVGRVVSGLPLESPKFAILPPFFKQQDKNDETVKTAVNDLFPNIPTNLKRVAEFCLASVVFHSDYLRNNLPNNHNLFSNALFRNRRLLDTLKAQIECRLGKDDDDDPITATGIPPTVALLCQMTVLNESIMQIIPTLERTAQATVNAIVVELEERAIGAGTVTRDGLLGLLNDSIFGVLNQHGIIHAIQNMNHNNQIRAPQANSSPHNDTNSFWNMMSRQLPADFKLHPVNILIAFQLWCLGDESKSYPPYRLLIPENMPNDDVRKRFCDFGKLMQFFERKLRESNMWITNPSLSEVNGMITDLLQTDDLEFLRRTPKNRVRRINQIGWRTAAEHVRRERGLRE
eukprot:NODE_831_length_3642_cov_0.596669.p1 type:complete len:758 gc:universal NODE_831_length_3642_cov_0.596669:113-2386(+)